MARTPSKRGTITLMAVGDVLVDRDDPNSAFTPVLPVLGRADILFGDCEGVYTDRPTGNPPPGLYGAIRAPARNLEALVTAGFHVMGFANNVCLESGYEPFFDTLHGLRSRGITPVGAGNNSEEACAPVVVEKNGVRVAFLAYACAFPYGFEAGPNKPGCAPMRAHAVYKELDPIPPGSRAQVLTFADRKDLAALKQNVARARSQADIVVASFHWGLYNQPFTLADYEEDVGHGAIDAGADLVVGHHQRMLKGVEKYSGKFIFHGLGCFVVDLWDIDKKLPPAVIEGLKQMHGEYSIYPREGYPSFPFSPAARRTIIVRCEITDGALARISCIPCLINTHGQPIPVSPGTREFDEVADFLTESSRKVGFNTTFTMQGKEMVLS